MRVAIIGAGLAGLACGGVLTGWGHAVVLFDKGRGSDGGWRRADCRPMPARGASILARNTSPRAIQGFATQVEPWAEQGLAARWAAAGEDAWVGTPTMNAPVRALAVAADVRWQRRVEALVHDDGWRLTGADDAGGIDAAVVAVPAEQVASLVGPHNPAMAGMSEATHSAPCWTVMAAFATPVQVVVDRLTRAGILGSAVRNSVTPGRSGPEAWVLQADADWSRQHLEDAPDTVERALIDALAAAADRALPPTLVAAAHRWRYAKSGALERQALWNPALRLGLCGDWLIGPRVQAAWLSGRRLAALIG